MVRSALPDESREKLLLAALRHVAFDGWTARALEAGADDVGFAASDVVRAFPGGVADAIVLFSLWADGRMLVAVAPESLEAMRTSARVAALVRARLDALAPHREAMRRALAWSALPGHQAVAARCLARTVDAIWYAAGDRSADFSYYTKRALLSAVYAATVLVWIDDRSAGSADTWSFFDRRLAEVGRLHGLRARADAFFRGIARPAPPRRTSA
jgi:ubiquinone biosynthesis protein COQ9